MFPRTEGVRKNFTSQEFPENQGTNVWHTGISPEAMKSVKLKLHLPVKILEKSIPKLLLTTAAYPPDVGNAECPSLESHFLLILQYPGL